MATPARKFRGPLVDLGLVPGRRSSAEAGGGWVSPDGRFWPAPDYRHQEVAKAVVKELGLNVGRGDPADYLENAGWSHVNDRGVIVTGVLDRTLTQRQLDTLFDLARAHPSMRENMLAQLLNATVA